MVVSELFKIEKNLPVNGNEIEKFFKKMKIEPIRWAIVNINEKELIISVAYDKIVL